MPVAASQVVLRVEPAVLYVAALVVAAPRFENTLNRLQNYWARCILGTSCGPRIRWALYVA